MKLPSLRSLVCTATDIVQFGVDLVAPVKNNLLVNDAFYFPAGSSWAPVGNGSPPGAWSWEASSGGEPPQDSSSGGGDLPHPLPSPDEHLERIVYLLEDIKDLTEDIRDLISCEIGENREQ